MLRGSSVLFTAFLVIFYRKRKLYRYEWIGVILVVIGLVMLGFVAVFQEDKGKHYEAWQIICGIILTAGSQSLEALKAVLQEVYLHDSHMHSMYIISWQGFWGFMMCTCVFMPICYFLPGDDNNGLREDSVNTLYQLLHSWEMVVLSFVYIISQFFCNLYAAYLIKVTSALTRMILEQFRALSVWIISVFLYYVITKKYGEEWTDWSFLEAGGFIVLTAGVIIYAGAIDVKIIMGDVNPPSKEVKEV